LTFISRIFTVYWRKEEELKSSADWDEIPYKTPTPWVEVSRRPLGPATTSVEMETATQAPASWHFEDHGSAVREQVEEKYVRREKEAKVATNDGDDLRLDCHCSKQKYRHARHPDPGSEVLRPPESNLYEGESVFANSLGELAFPSTTAAYPTLTLDVHENANYRPR
jgi:hypothetical protein